MDLHQRGMFYIFSKMKKISLSLCLLTTVLAASSQSKPAGKILARAELHKKFGCIDLKGSEIVPIQYDDIGSWGYGLIAVNKGGKAVDYHMEGGKWGYCNENGKLVIPLQYEKTETFSEELAAVKIDGKWGFIDTTGKMAIQPRYDETRMFAGGLCAVCVKKKWGYINVRGEMMIRPEYTEAFEFDKGVAKVYAGKLDNDMTGERATGGYCIINKKGQRLIGPIFAYIGIWHEGFAKVKDSRNKVGFVNRQGKIVVPLVYDEADDFSEGLAPVGKMVKGPDDVPDAQYEYGYVNTDGRLVISGPFSRAETFYKGLAIVGKGVQKSSSFFAYNVADHSIVDSADQPKYALINKSGKYVLPFKWGGLQFIDGNRLIASKAGYLASGVIDKKGNELLPFSYTILHYAGHDLLIGEIGDEPGKNEINLINGQGRTLFKTTRFTVNDLTYNYGLLPVRTNNQTKSGFVNIHGNWVIPDKYDMVWDFESTRP